LSCWAKAGHPDVGYVSSLAGTNDAASPVGADLCKHCGGSIDWELDGVPFGDGTNAHVACYERED
jgi:hypothetical protein